jgi:hypothetical protein
MIDFLHDASVWCAETDPETPVAIYIEHRAFWRLPDDSWNEMRTPADGPSAGPGFAGVVLRALEDPQWSIEPNVETRAETPPLFRLVRRVESLGDTEMAIDVSIDPHGRIWRLAERRGPLRGTAGDIVLEDSSTAYEFRDFGIDVNVEPPRDDQIRTVTTAQDWGVSDDEFDLPDP